MKISMQELTDALRATGHERRQRVARLAGILMDGESLPSSVKLSLMCQTCGFQTDEGSVEDRDRQHMAKDGAHDPGWVDEWPDGHALIHDDYDLLYGLVRRAVVEHPDPVEVHVLSATSVETGAGPEYLTMCENARYAWGERRDEYIVGNYSSDNSIKLWATCVACRSRGLSQG